jgi:drug/metabolite transporter (DMT)-like permease
MLVLLVWISIQRQMWREFGRAFEQEFGVLRSPRILSITIGTAFAGTYLGIWLQQTALKYAPAGIAQSLVATSPLFVIPLSLWLGERVSPRAIVGVVLALGGIWLLFMQR